MFLRAPDRFRRVRDPNGTIWTTFGPPAGPKNFSVGGPGGPEKKFFPKNFFCSKTLFIGSCWVLGPKKLILGPSRPPTRGHFGPFYTQNGQNGIQKRPKNAFFS